LLFKRQSNYIEESLNTNIFSQILGEGMQKLFLAVFLFSFVLLFSSSAYSQDANIMHVQKWKMKSMLGDDAKAFYEMLQRQSSVLNKDSRVLRFHILRHFWGADSRDLIFITEFKSTEDLFSFYDDMNGMLEKEFSKEQLDMDNDLFNKYIGEHGDEIYQEVPGTRK
jgi:hypothetical protein